jgi:hypothetical protein
MKIAIEAARTLTYETSRVCDLEHNNLRVLESDPPADKEEFKRRKADSRVYKRLNGMLTPMSKYYASEMCVRVANDALQVLGGSGYMKDYPIERYLRDARITTIYEGTSQMQVVAAVRGVCSGAFQMRVEELESYEYFDKALSDLTLKLGEGKQLVLDGVAFVKKQGVEYMDLYGRKLVDSAITVLVGHMLLQQAAALAKADQAGGNGQPGTTAAHKRLVAKRFIETGIATIRRDISLLRSGDSSVVSELEALAGPPTAVS